MAMGKESISGCRFNVNLLNNIITSNTDYNQAFNNIKSDAEYQKFISQTEIGKVLAEKLIKSLELYGSLWESLEGLVGKTNKFLDAQEALNNRQNAGSGGGFNE